MASTSSNQPQQNKIFLRKGVPKRFEQNLSFAGCGFLGLYHVGVASAFRSFVPDVEITKVYGASAGSIAAAAMLSDVPLGEMTSHILNLILEARKRLLGPFHPRFNINRILKDGLDRLLPEDVHTKVNGKLFISLTKVYDGDNMIISKFSSKAEVIEAILASSFIPLFSGYLPPRIRGVRVIDGGYSNNLPIRDRSTITVSPFCGAADICPADDKEWKAFAFRVSIANNKIDLTKENFRRFSRVLLPPSPEILSGLCQAGFNDAMRYLQRRYMISCTRCLAISSTFELEAEENPDFPYRNSVEYLEAMNVPIPSVAQSTASLPLVLPEDLGLTLQDEPVVVKEIDPNCHKLSSKTHDVYMNQRSKAHTANCKDCDKTRTEANNQTIPDQINEVFIKGTEYEAENTSFFWNVGKKLVKVWAMPVTVPLSVSMYMGSAMWEPIYNRLPDLIKDIDPKKSTLEILDELSDVFNSKDLDVFGDTIAYVREKLEDKIREHQRARVVDRFRLRRKIQEAKMNNDKQQLQAALAEAKRWKNEEEDIRVDGEHPLSARYTCQFSITQYGDDEDQEDEGEPSSLEDNQIILKMDKIKEERAKNQEMGDESFDGEDEMDDVFDSSTGFSGSYRDDDSPDDVITRSILSNGSKSPRDNNPKDLLSVEFTAEIETDGVASFPRTQEAAIRFQNKNLAAAISSPSSRVHSRVGSRAGSRTGSKAGSRLSSRMASRQGSCMGSRSSSFNSLADLDEAAPDSIHLLREVTSKQNAIMAFYYTDEMNKVKVVEMFDVTHPMRDELGVDYSQEHLHFPHGQPAGLDSLAEEPSTSRNVVESINPC